MNKPPAFSEPVFVTRPLLPSLSSYNELLVGIWQRQWLTNRGEMFCAFEKRLKEFLGLDGISIVSNGTLALQLATKALKLRGEVITTPFTFPATPHVLTWEGITPVFADISPDTLTLDPVAVEKAITPHTSGILGVHVYGMPCDVTALDTIAAKHNLRTLYDGAHSFGTRIGGKPLPLSGDATVLSFHATKLFHTVEGGAVVAKDADLLHEIDLLKNFGIEDEVTVRHAGINAKMNELQAAMGLLVLDCYEEERQARTEIAQLYKSHIEDIEGLSMFSLPDNVTYSAQYAILRVDEEKCSCDRDFLYDKLKEFNIFARRYFYPLCSEAVHYQSNPSASRDNLPNAYRASKEVLALPLYGALRLDGAAKVADAIRYIVEE